MMLLTVLDRILLLNALPERGDITTVRLVRQLREDLSFSDAEHTALKIEQIGESIRWDLDAAKTADKDIPVSGKQASLITATLEKLNTDKQLTAGFVGLYDKFVEPPVKD
jgi:hypothetical protein